MSSINKKNALIIFAKPPVAGLAKTRLIPALGKKGAAEYHGKLLHHTLKNTVSSPEWDTHLWCAEDLGHPFFQACLSQYAIKLQIQTTGDLGQRMAHAIRFMLKDYEKVCIIGSDCPVLDQTKIGKVFESLKSKNDVVVTPAEDGGYVLMAVQAQLNLDVFSGMQWGGDNVFQQTLHNLHTLKLNPVIQPTLWDVDTPDDLKRMEAFGPSFGVIA